MGIGVDIEEISRFEGKTLENDSHFLKNIFTQNELDYCFSKGSPAQHLCARFSAKEAVMKALSQIDSNIFFLDIEILNFESGQPYVNLLKSIEGVKVDISMSHSEKNAMAFAVVSKD